MKLATTIGDFLRFAPDAAGAVRMYEGTGFTHLDYSFYNAIYAGSPFMGEHWMDEVKAAGAAAEALGFDFVQAHSPGNNPFSEKEDFDTVVKGNIRSIEACGYLGIRNIVVHSGFSWDYRYPDGEAAYFEANRKFYEALYPAMEQHGVNVLIENSAHANMGGQYFFMTGKEMSDFIRYCSHPLLHACWDVGHANMQNPDQYGDLIALGDDLRAVHIQDNMGRTDDHLAPFMGTLDVDSVMRGLFDSGFVSRGGYFTFECDNVLSRAGSWPNYRNAFSGDKAKIPGATAAMKRAAIGMLYEIGKGILEAYDCFEK
ncbi:MAG: sugar phosphate isomerase/epimerase [Clostridia bacterium]|nr:sugar phosphate isomerase/epimerase [Clostridia bacterium]